MKINKSSILRNSENKEDVVIECIKCLRAIMNSKDGLKLIFNHKDSHRNILREDPLKIVAETLNPRYPSAMAVRCSLSIMILIETKK